MEIPERQEFNEKWNKYLVGGFYGLAINNEEAIKFLDGEFEKEILVNPNFNYSQIKLKFGACRIYTTSTKNSFWEFEIDKIISKI